jgi:hypothetical protein
VAGNISLNDNKITGLADPTEPQDATTKSYADSNFMKRDGTNPPTGNLNMNDNKLTDLANPTDPQDAINKRYAENNFMKRDGTNIHATGHISLNGNKIIRLANPTNFQDAATKRYVDSRKPVITIWAQENGPLNRGQYEWSFGGGDTPQMNGYCMPVSGRILRGSLSSINGINPPDQADINIVISGRATGHLVLKLAGEFSSTSVFNPPIEVSQNDRINFRTNVNDVTATNSIASLLIELDL